jgi:geranylgeranyl reductase family protein
VIIINHNLKPEFDSHVIVVGAGPAGVAASYYLASAGFKVILIDKQKFPRDKVCGDFVSPVAQDELSRLGITSLPAYTKMNLISKASAYLDGKELISKQVPIVQGLPKYGRVIPRMMLDNWLLDAARKAGAEVLEGLKAVNLELEKQCISLEVVSPSGTRNLRAHLLIGADGSNSTVARLMRGRTPSNRDRIIAIRGYYRGVEGPSNQADLHFNSESFPGYCWLFPTGKNEANVGVGVALDTIPAGNRLGELLNHLIEDNVALHERLHKAKRASQIAGWPLAIYNPNLPVIDNRVMLVGDAAGLVNPLNGEGIQYALLSGRWASEVAVSCLTKNDFSRDALSAYSDIIEKELRYDMSLASMIVQLIRNRSLNPVWLGLLKLITAHAKTDPNYADTVGGILMGSTPQSRAFSMEIVIGTLEQAVLSTGYKGLKTIQDPRFPVKAALDAVEMSLDVTRQVTMNPFGFINWVANSAASAMDVAIAASTRYSETLGKRRS